jgi:hypothetical protein
LVGSYKRSQAKAYMMQRYRKAAPVATKIRSSMAETPRLAAPAASRTIIQHVAK